MSSSSTPFCIPHTLKDVSADWVAELLYRHLGAPRPDGVGATDGTHDGITLLRIRACPTSLGFRESCHVACKCSTQPHVTHKLLVEIVPSDPDLREVIVRHNLFAKEVLFYSEVLPLLSDYVRRRANVSKAVDVTFSVPKYLYGEYDASAGRGVMVFEDFTETGPYSTEDDSLMLLLDPGRVRDVVSNLATFHAICAAFQATEPRGLDSIFPLLDGDAGGAAWFHEDMHHFLEEMYKTCRDFLQSIPGQESLCRWFEQKMSSPVDLHKDANVPLCSKFKSVIHGDLWHNNVYFLKQQQHGAGEVKKGLKEDRVPFLFADWQMCHVGNATNDLCFLLFSSTTPAFRRDHWDETMVHYYDGFVTTLRSLGVTERELSVSFQEFELAVRASVPLSLFFCGNVQDFDLHAEAADARKVGERAIDGGGEDSDLEETFRKLQNCLEVSEESKGTPEVSSVDSFPVQGGSVPCGSGGIQINFSREDSVPETQTGDQVSPSEQQQRGQPSAVGPVLLPVYRRLCKVPTIASETDLRRVEALRARSSGGKSDLDPRRARALRRKLYLELYKEAAGKGFI